MKIELPSKWTMVMLNIALVDPEMGKRAYQRQRQVTRGGQRAHDDAVNHPRARHGLLPGSPCAIRHLKLHKAGAVVSHRLMHAR